MATGTAAATRPRKAKAAKPAKSTALARAELSPLDLYRSTPQGRLDRAERLSTPGSFGSIDAPTLVSYLEAADRGDTRKMCALIGYFLDTDEEFSADYEICLDRICQSDWTWKPADPSPEAAAACEFIEAATSRVTNWHTALRELLDAIVMPLSACEMAPFEWCSELNAYIAYGLKHRESHRFQFDDQWRPRLYDATHKSHASRYGQPLKPGKWIVHYHRARAANPSKYGVGRSLLWLLLFKRWEAKGEVMYLSKYGSPFLQGIVPPNAPANVRAAMLTGLQNMVSDGAAVLEEGSEIKAITGLVGATGENAHGAYTERCNRAIAKRLLGMSDATSPGDNGSRADSVVRTGATADPLMVSRGEALGVTLRQDYATALLDWNLHLFGGKRPPVPVFRFKASENEATATAPSPGEEDGSPEFDAGNDPLQPLRDYAPRRPSARAGRPPTMRAKGTHYSRLRAALMG